MPNLRNIAVIAHVDHGKTTLIDALLKQTHTFRDNQQEMQQEQILDRNDLERERGITILAKNCAIEFNNTKINIIDTPGHADFSGEVERTLNMADGALLIIDAQEGPMPQTRFVLKKALELNLKIIVVINKIDKPNADLPRTENNIDDLFLDLAAHEDQLHFPKLYAIAKEGKVFSQLPTQEQPDANMTPLLETILENIPEPDNNPNGPFKLSITSLDYDNHLGRIVIGKVHQGSISKGAQVTLANKPGKKFTIDKLMSWQGLAKQEIDSASAGEIVALSGIPDGHIGDTVSDPSDTSVLPSPEIGEPTMQITLGTNTSPFAGKEGDYSTSRQLEERLDRELESNVGLKITKDGSGFRISGRGELHLSILLETMRREGYEMEVGRPQVIIKEIDGQKQEPLEEAAIIIPTEYQGVISQEFGQRYGDLIKLHPISDTEIEMIYHIPSRATIGLRGILLTATKGTVIYNSQVIGWQLLGKPLTRLRRGALLASESGTALSYGLRAAQERGITFIPPGTPVYQGMIVGLSSKDKDMEINVCKGKKLTNMRASSAEIIVQLTPPTVYSLEQSLDFLEDDELLEITPLSLRLRKRGLTDVERRRATR